MILPDLKEEDKIIFNIITPDKKIYREKCESILKNLGYFIRIKRNDSLEITDIGNKVLKVPYSLYNSGSSLDFEIDNKKIYIGIDKDLNTNELLYYLVIAEKEKIICK